MSKTPDYTNGEIKRHIDVGADCIYRHKFNSKYFDPISGNTIDLHARLEREGKLDIDVYLSDENRTRVRLIAAPVSQEVANNRRMKAKREIKGRKPSDKMLHQMSWTIFITTIPQSQADFQEILKIYRLRWRIEIIFKIWKSHMQFAKVHNVSENQLRTLLTARLIMIVICTHNIYRPCYLKIRKNCNRELSMMRLFNYLMKNPEKLIELLTLLQRKSQETLFVFDKLVRYCTYDKRKRLNLNQLQTNIFLS
ncbi:MAG: transposase [Candidatus Cloacimonetes bacterium]|nr:transposase [Candidatus Cloacimonadota bacterium]